MCSTVHERPAQSKWLALLWQGVVEARNAEDSSPLHRHFTFVLISRRSRLHPGMRYIARGLNALASPGNEIECEQVQHKLQVWLFEI